MEKGVVYQATLELSEIFDSRPRGRLVVGSEGLKPIIRRTNQSVKALTQGSNMQVIRLQCDPHLLSPVLIAVFLRSVLPAVVFGLSLSFQANCIVPGVSVIYHAPL